MDSAPHGCAQAPTGRTWEIYRIQNTRTGRAYFGQTSQGLAVRWQQHIKGSRRSRTKIGRSIYKHGPDAFCVSLVCVCHSKAEADLTERMLISANRTIESGYNLTKGGEGNYRLFCKVGHRLPAKGGRCPPCKKRYLKEFKARWKTVEDMRAYNREQMRKHRAQLAPGALEKRRAVCREGKKAWYVRLKHHPERYAAHLELKRQKNKERYQRTKDARVKTC